MTSVREVRSDERPGGNLHRQFARRPRLTPSLSSAAGRVARGDVRRRANTRRDSAGGTRSCCQRYRAWRRTAVGGRTCGTRRDPDRGQERRTVGRSSTSEVRRTGTRPRPHAGPRIRGRDPRRGRTDNRPTTNDSKPSTIGAEPALKSAAVSATGNRGRLRASGPKRRAPPGRRPSCWQIGAGRGRGLPAGSASRSGFSLSRWGGLSRSRTRWFRCR